MQLVEGGRCAKHCHGGVEKEPEGVAVGFGRPWKAAADGAGRAGPIFSTCDPHGNLRDRGGAQEGHRQPGSSSPASPPPPLSAWRSGWACAGRLARCQQFFLPRRQEGTGPN